jgi:hypothetical protein
MKKQIDKYYNVKFYFVSGKQLEVEYNEVNKNTLIEKLKNWNTVNAIGQDFGINFTLVTHYEVNEI